MNIRSINIIPKVQMQIHGLLKQYDQKHINLRFQQYSIEHTKQNNKMSIVFYSPDYQSIEWGIQFLDISSLSHISLSVYKNKSRLLYYKSKDSSLYFYQGYIRNRQSKFILKQKFIKSVQKISLNIKNDQVLFISDDLYEKENNAVYLIATVKGKYFVLKANINKVQLIELDNTKSVLSSVSSSGWISNIVNNLNINKNINNIKSILSSYTSNIFHKQNSSQIQIPLHYNNILVTILQDNKQSFKTIIYKDLVIQILFVNIPLIPDNKIKNQIMLKKTINLKQSIEKIFENDINKQNTNNQININAVDIVISRIYKLSNADVCLLMVVKPSLNSIINPYLISYIINFQKNQITITNSCPIVTININTIDIMKIPQQSSILIKYQQQKTHEYRLYKLNICTLAIQQQLPLSIFNLHGDIRITISKQTQKIFLLSPLKISQLIILQYYPQSFTYHSQQQQQQYQYQQQQDYDYTMDSQQMGYHNNNNNTNYSNEQIYRISKQIYKQFVQPRIKGIKHVFTLNNIMLTNQVNSILTNLSFRIKQLIMYNSQQELYIQQIFKLYSFLQFTVIFLRIFQRNLSNNNNSNTNNIRNILEQTVSLDYILSCNLNQVRDIFIKIFENQQDLLFLSIWNSFFTNLKNQQFYQLNIRDKLKFYNLTHKFSAIVHKVLENLYKGKQHGNFNNQNIQNYQNYQNHQNIINTQSNQSNQNHQNHQNYHYIEQLKQLQRQFIQQSSGIIQLSLGYYRQWINKNPNEIMLLKKVSYNTLNQRLISLLYFQTQIVNNKDLSIFFQSYKKQFDQQKCEQFIQDFLNQYLSRVEQGKFGKSVQIVWVINIFKDYVQFAQNCLKDKKQKIQSLFKLRQGKINQLQSTELDQIFRKYPHLKEAMRV